MSGEAYALLAVLVVLAALGALLFRQGVKVAQADRATDEAKEAIDNARIVKKFAEDMGDVDARCAALESEIRALPHGPARAARVRELLTLRLRAATGRNRPPAAPGDRPAA